MPRYRYNEAFFNAPPTAGAWIKVPVISTGIAILEAIGEGKLGLKARESRTPRFLYGPMVKLSIEELRGHAKDEILRLFDREVDIALAHQEVAGSCARYFPHELAAKFKPDGCVRMRHFAALLISGIKIGDWNVQSPADAAALDAALTHRERDAAYPYYHTKKLTELIADVYPFADEVNS